MSPAQVEIIGPRGDVAFKDLDAIKGITNIGRHPENDIVIESPEIPPFYAMLDHRQYPYRLLILAHADRSLVQGKQPPADMPVELCTWDTLQIAGYSLILLDREGGSPAGARPTALPDRAGAEAGAGAGPGAGNGTPADGNGQSATPSATRTPPGAPILTTPPPAGGAGAPAGAPTAPPAPLPAAPPPQRPTAARPAADQVDGTILVEVSEREWSIDVDQTASCPVTVINGGEIVAAFQIRVEGLPESWVTVTPADINLFRARRAQAMITVTPPRSPSSRAGPHPFVIIVTSPNYPGHESRTGATVNIFPYYEFGVSDLSPSQPSLARKGYGETSITVTNKSNNDATFRLTGEDDEAACRFAIQAPGDEAALAGQAELKLQPAGSIGVPIHITPLRRKLVGMTAKLQPFRITTTMTVGGEMPRAVPGQLRVPPRVHFLLVVLVAACLAALGVFQFRPGPEPLIEATTSAGPAGQPAAQPAAMQHQMTASSGRPSGHALELPARSESNFAQIAAFGLPTQTVTINYDASRYQSLAPTHILNRLNGLFVRLTLEYKPEGSPTWDAVKAGAELPVPDGTATHVPSASGEYRLRSNNLISQLVPALQGVSNEVPVIVSPIEPNIVDFKVDRATFTAGQPVTLYWKTKYVETLTLIHDELEETIKDEDIESGQRIFELEKDTTFTLVAANSSWPAQVKMIQQVKLFVPPPTPMPTPVIVQFDVQPLVITVGDPITITWDVTGADTVSIDPVKQGLPIKGNMPDQPPKSQSYLLTASKIAADGTEAKAQSLLREVTVNTPQPPTPAPIAPEIQVFEASPKEVVAGDLEVVVFTWSISGATTNVELSSADVTLAGLKAQDSVTVTVNATGLFVLTALNGELKRSKALEVKALAPTPTPSPPPPPTATPVPTAPPTPYPDPIINYFTVEGLNPATDIVQYNQATGVYQIEAGANVKFKWDAAVADKAQFEGEDGPPQNGEKAILNLIDPTKVSYKLAVENKGGKTAERYIQVNLIVTVPPAPLALSGVQQPTGNVLTWAYDPAYRNKIIGFRVYRSSDTSPNDFAAIATLSDAAMSTWTDVSSAENITCGRGYYLVAMYMDIVRNGQIMETASSATSWYSQPCSQ